MLNHVDIHMKSFIKTKECRRKTLLSHFESVSMYPEQPHLCCDNCGTQCKCGMLHSDNITKDPFTTYKDTLPTSTEREVSQQQLKVVEENLIKYHKSTVMQLVGATASGNVKTYRKQFNNSCWGFHSTKFHRSWITCTKYSQ